MLLQVVIPDVCEFLELCRPSKRTEPRSARGSYTEPRILMDSIWSPGKHLEVCQESTWSPSGVHQESPWSPSASSHCALPKNPARLLMESIRMETFPGLLIQSLKTRAGLSRWTPLKPI